MRYSLEPKYRKYVQGYGFLSFARKFGDKYGKKLMDIATKAGIDTAKTPSKRVVQQTAEATGDLIGNKITDKITSLGKSTNKENQKKMKQINEKKFTYHQKKESKLLMTKDCFKHSIKKEYENITNLLDSIPDKVPRCITKKWIEVYDQSGGSCNINKQIRFKKSVLQSDFCDYSDTCIVLRGDITVEEGNNRDRKNRSLAFKNNASFVSCISKINSVFIGNAEEIDVVMP